MSILIDENNKVFTLHTRSTTYQLGVNQWGHLLHLYYGRRVNDTCMADQFVPQDCGFSPNTHAARYVRTQSLDILPQEYSGSNTVDFRLPSLKLVTEGGCYGVDLYVTGWTVDQGKEPIPGLPSSFAGDDAVETLTVTLEDQTCGIKAELRYSVFADSDIITRSVKLTNSGSHRLRVEKAASMCLDLPYGDWELLNFHGRHCKERMAERLPLRHGIQTVASRRGASSHQLNPFVVLCDRHATEDFGECVAAMLVYSGNFSAEIELDQMNSTRMVMGINPEQFAWYLAPEETFSTPEVLLTYSHTGLATLSQRYHTFIRDHIIRSRWNRRPRPVLINNWEATYFSFNTDKILSIARQAAELGVELMVLDDGWFGKRDDDHSGLGDWFVNEEKLPGGLEPLISGVEALGMKFGIWVEPEMVSEDSDLYRTHPDWAFAVPGRAPAVGRDQLVLDFSRPEVVDYLDERLTDLLSKHHISYVKWDMNRHLTDVYSPSLPPQRQGEVFHRYMLGVYELLERLTTRFPEVLFEGCSGGGGRFDAGMMAYFPQIWCSDDTDAIERMDIQYGTSFGYPISTVGSHVSTCPNHQTGRTTPFGTRAVVAMSGTFGYELDLNLLSDGEKAEVREQIQRFHAHYDLIQNGDYFRLCAPDANGYFTAWQFVAQDQSETLVSLVMTHPTGNPQPVHFRMKGLAEDGRYELTELRYFGCHGAEEQGVQVGTVYPGSRLMYAGMTLPQMFGDYPSVQMMWKKVRS